MGFCLTERSIYLLTSKLINCLVISLRLLLKQRLDSSLRAVNFSENRDGYGQPLVVIISVLA